MKCIFIRIPTQAQAEATVIFSFCQMFISKKAIFLKAYNMCSATKSGAAATIRRSQMFV